MATWVDVANFINQELRDTDFENDQAKVVLDLWAGESGVTVQARLFNATVGESAGESPEVTASLPTDATFIAALASGRNTYRLQVTSDPPDVDIFAMATLYRLEE